MSQPRICRRKFLENAAAAAPLAVVAAFGQQQREARRRPNILFLLTDDHRWDALGCMGNPIIRTPHLDGLASRATVFDNMFVTTSICCASRASIFTGQYSSRHGVHGFNTPFTPRALSETYPQVLRRHGYRVGFIGKYGVGDNVSPPSDQFDYWRGFTKQGSYFQTGANGKEVHLTDLMTEQASEFVDGCSEQPFCLSVSFKAPHCQDGDPRQFLYAPRYADLYSDAEIPYPETFNPQYFQAQPDYIRNSEARKRWEIRFSTPELYQQMVKGYYRLITGVDDAVGHMMAALRQRGLDQNTVVVFTGDNGFFLGEHGLAGKWFMHEESIRVPLIIYDPRRSPGRTRQRPTEMALNIDLAPTILSLAGCPIPGGMQGRDLTPLLLGESTGWRNDWFYEHRFVHGAIPMSEGVRTSRYSFWRYLNVEDRREWLFDLEKDPRQKDNLAPDPQYSNIASQLRRRLEQYRGSAG
jgi:arylsulfatase A-like enzyme